MTMMHGISPFSLHHPPAFRDIQPANIPAASPEPVTPVSHSMAQEMLYDRWERMIHRFVDGQIISVIT
jgi:hypothetical protein